MGKFDGDGPQMGVVARLQVEVPNNVSAARSEKGVWFTYQPHGQMI